MPGKLGGAARVGISGWSNPAFYGSLYPKGLPSQAMLSQYAKAFTSVEVNSTFYSQPTLSLCDRWYRETPPDFTFAVKAHRTYTHTRQLVSGAKDLSYFLKVISRLKEKLGPILFQFPERPAIPGPVMEDFLRQLPKGFKYAVELRRPPFEEVGMLRVLEDNGVAAVCHDFFEEGILHVTAPFAYVRLHGPDVNYEGAYSVKDLKLWAWRVVEWLNDDIDVFVYFNNTKHGEAVGNALTFQHLLLENPGLPPRKQLIAPSEAYLY